MKKSLFVIMSLVMMTVLFSSCRPRTNPNEWVVSTGTCWNTMTVSKAGDAIPRLFTACDRLIVLPATDMSADFSVQTKFEHRAAATANLTYNWRITDPELFIHSTKVVTSSATGSDGKIDPNALESIENSVVDKMLIDIVREYTPSLAAGTNELSIESKLMELSSAKVASRGVTFSGMSLNIVFAPQIEEALDILSALEFYESQGQKELGIEVIKAKAGSANIHTIASE
jgi:hypothetical protein